MKIERYIIWLIAFAAAIKIALFLYILCCSPESIMLNDSGGYLDDARGWSHFAAAPLQGLKHSLYRTPGYPLFLSVFHHGLNLPLMSIVFLQIVLNFLSAGVVYRAFHRIDRPAALLAAAILLLDLPATIYSSMIMTESFHLFAGACFLWTFVVYVETRRFKYLFWSAFLLAISVYIRPVGFFLGFAIAGFLIYLWGRKEMTKGLKHAAVFLVIVYSLLGIWQCQNLMDHGEFTISSIDRATIGMHGIIGRYSRETDPQLRGMSPPVYYFTTITRNFLSLMTTPGSMKYFHSRVLSIVGVCFGYILVAFWWSGLIFGLKQCRSDKAMQMLWVILIYFISVSLFSTGWMVTPRFRVPMLPAIAILAGSGWVTFLRSNRFFRV